MQITAEQLAASTGATLPLAQRWLPFIRPALSIFEIDTPTRVAAFLATIGHESGGLRWTSEIWGPTEIQKRYEGRADLGNTMPGDGSKFRGHGLIQVTGRYNHARVRDRLRERFKGLREVPDFEASPELLGQPEWAALSAGDYWDEHKVNVWADMGSFDGVCDVVNKGRKTRAEGDAIGYADRLAMYEKALKVLS